MHTYTLLLQGVLLRVGSAEARAGRCGMLGDVVHSRRVVLSVAAAEAAGESHGDHLDCPAQGESNVTSASRRHALVAVRRMRQGQRQRQGCPA